jgi:hypothetical protein
MPPGNKKTSPKKNNLDQVQVKEEESTVVPLNDELSKTTNNISESEIPPNLENVGGAEVIQPNTTAQAKSKAKKKDKLPVETPNVTGGGKTSKKITPTKTNKKKSTDKKETLPKSKAKKKSLAQKTDTNTEQESDDEVSNIRSFKVKLPDSDIFKGRFTGLTPYQAANKALSKFFRLNKNILNTEIEFNICESTRKSKKTIYSYIGRRYKLDTPVKYEIKDSEGNTREIIKNFKNSLRKIKKINNSEKSEVTETAT